MRFANYVLLFSILYSFELYQCWTAVNLFSQGVDFSQRCFGNFFTPEDQKGTRTHSLEYEWVEMRSETNYEGYVFEYATFKAKTKFSKLKVGPMLYNNSVTVSNRRCRHFSSVSIERPKILYNSRATAFRDFHFWCSPNWLVQTWSVDQWRWTSVIYPCVCVYRGERDRMRCAEWNLDVTTAHQSVKDRPTSCVIRPPTNCVTASRVAQSIL